MDTFLITMVFHLLEIFKVPKMEARKFNLQEATLKLLKDQATPELLKDQATTGLLLKDQATLNLLKDQATTNLLEVEIATNLLKVETTNLLKVVTTTNLLKVETTTNLLKVETTTNLLKVETKPMIKIQLAVTVQPQQKDVHLTLMVPPSIATGNKWKLQLAQNQAKVSLCLKIADQPRI